MIISRTEYLKVNIFTTITLQNTLYASKSFINNSEKEDNFIKTFVDMCTMSELRTHAAEDESKGMSKYDP